MEKKREDFLSLEMAHLLSKLALHFTGFVFFLFIFPRENTCEDKADRAELSGH